MSTLPNAGGGLPHLPFRERELVDLLCEGYSQKEIASLMGIAPRTVKKYIHEVAAKWDIDSKQYHLMVRIAYLWLHNT